MFDQSAYTVDEGGMVGVVVQLCGNITNDVVVTFMTNGDTAEAGSDYTSETVDLTFSATTTSQTVMIMASNDSIVETQEMFTLSVTTTNSAVMPQSVSITVSITDMTKVMIDFDRSDYSVTEGGSVIARMKVMLEVTLDIDVVVTVQIGDGSDSAVAGSDYAIVFVDITICAGTTIRAGATLSQTVIIVAFTDNIVENEETFTLSLTIIYSGVMHLSVSITVSITDLTTVMIAFDQRHYFVSEGMTVVAKVRVSSGITLDRDVVVTVETAEGFGTNGAESSDYNSVSRVLTFNANTHSETVSIMITTDNIVENQEWFILSLNTIDSAVIPQSFFSIVIISD
jgi:hypothetical protein